MSPDGIELRVKRILELLPPSINDLSSEFGYFDGEPYIKHIPQVVDKAQKEFLILCNELGIINKSFLQDKVHRQGIVGRYIDDSNINQISTGWYRFMCIDEDYKEWQQPYYAINFKKYVGYSLNDNPRIKQFFRNQKLEDLGITS